jgi:disulfide bond formation protein DsbB
MQIAPIANHLLSFLAVIAQITVVVLLLSLFIRSALTKKILTFFRKHAMLFAFLVALTATLGSLFYSEILGYTPCKLCWYQRILMYPQVLLLGFAYWRKDRHIVDYSIILSILGIGIAFYHYLLQRNVVSEILPCSAVGYSVSCAEKFVMTYGYITIPLMSLSAFFLILVLMVIKKRASK